MRCRFLVGNSKKFAIGFGFWESTVITVPVLVGRNLLYFEKSERCRHTNGATCVLCYDSCFVDVDSPSDWQHHLA